MRFLFLWGEMLSSFLAYISMSLLKTSSKMEFNSRLDDKTIDCSKNQKQQPVTLQYQFYFQKFSDFLRARTQNVHFAVLYYE